MFLTNLLLAKKAKAKHIMVVMESMVSGHKFLTCRERLGDKLQLMQYDPYINDVSVYKELKKVRSMSASFKMDPKIQKILGLDIEEEINRMKIDFKN